MALIIKIDDYYFEWSTIADAPKTKGMALPLLAHYIAESYGLDGLFILGERLQRVERTGTSAVEGTTLDALLACNRAGPGERRLTKEEILRQYVPTPHTRGPWDALPSVCEDPPPQCPASYEFGDPIVGSARMQVCCQKLDGHDGPHVDGDGGWDDTAPQCAPPKCAPPTTDRQIGVTEHGDKVFAVQELKSEKERRDDSQVSDAEAEGAGAVRGAVLGVRTILGTEGHVGAVREGAEGGLDGAVPRLVRCWRCKHDVPEEMTVCNAGIGTQCKDSKACRGRWYGPHRPSEARIRSEERSRAGRIIRNADDRAPLGMLADAVEHGDDVPPCPNEATRDERVDEAYRNGWREGVEDAQDCICEPEVQTRDEAVQRIERLLTPPGDPPKAMSCDVFTSVLTSDLDRVKVLLGLDPVQDGIAQVAKLLEQRPDKVPSDGLRELSNLVRAFLKARGKEDYLFSPVLCDGVQLEDWGDLTPCGRFATRMLHPRRRRSRPACDECAKIMGYDGRDYESAPALRALIAALCSETARGEGSAK